MLKASSLFTFPAQYAIITIANRPGCVLMKRETAMVNKLNKTLAVDNTVERFCVREGI